MSYLRKLMPFTLPHCKNLSRRHNKIKKWEVSIITCIHLNWSYDVYICVLYPRNVASHIYCDTGTTPGGRAVIFDLNTDEWISVMCKIIKSRQTKVMAIKIENQIRTGSASSAYLLKRIWCLCNIKSVTFKFKTFYL